MSILDHCPVGWTLRPDQRDILLAVEAGWDRHDVIMLLAPTASGKTLIGMVIARWRAALGEPTTIIAPENILVEQSKEKFPELALLARQDSYHCETWGRDCGTTKRKQKGHCKGCPYVAAKKCAQTADIKLANNYVYYAQRLYSPVLIADEADRLLDMLEDKREIKMWRSDFQFPKGLMTAADVIEWAQAALREAPNHKLELSLREIIRIRDGAAIEYRQMDKRGKADVCLAVVPSLTRAVPTWLWPPDRVKKIVLMSATIGPRDVAELGLAGRRVLYLSCPSPIPSANRPFLFEPRCNLAMKYRDKALPFFAKVVLEKLAIHADKGVIHLPYQMAEDFRDLCDDPRLMFHDRDNKAEVLERFQASPPDEGRVLVASGLYTGVDFAFDAARWQIIGVVPWLFFGDEKVKARAEADRDWADWQAIRKILQAYGRIVRGPTDRGTTYICDSNFERLYNTDMRRKEPQFPRFFRDAVKGRGLK